MSESHPNDVAFSGEFDPDFDELDLRLRQGDVLEFTATTKAWHGAQPLSPWRNYLAVVVTANCDLVWDKSGGHLTVVPLVPVLEYISFVSFPAWAARDARSYRSKAEALLSSIGSSVSLERVLELHADGTSVTTALPPNTSGDDLNTLISLLNGIAEVQRWSDSMDEATDVHGRIHATLNAYEKIGMARKRNSPNNVAKELQNRLLSQLKDLPGDAMFIGRPLRDTASDGYIAYLRLLINIQLSEVSVSYIQERRSATPIVARRCGRLSTLYSHRLAQQLSGVFNNIGLPSPYETFRDDSLKRIAGQLTLSNQRTNGAV